MKTKILLTSMIVPIFFLASPCDKAAQAASEAKESTAWKMKKVATSFSLTDGMAYWNSGNDNRNYQIFRCRPFLAELPKWLPMSGDYGDEGALVNALDGNLSFSVTLSDGTLKPLIYSDIIAIEKRPYYMKVTYLVESTVRGSQKHEKSLEFLVIPNSHALLYRWNEATGGNYKFRVRVYAEDGGSMKYPKPPSVNDFFDYGAGLYGYDSKTNIFRQTPEKTYDNRQTGHYPCSAIVFCDKPDGYTITDKGKNDSKVSAIQNSFNNLNGNAMKTVNTGKVFLAEYHVTKPRSVAFGFCFADNLKSMSAAQTHINSKTFEQWKQYAESHWSDYINQAYSKIKQKLKCDLSKLSLDEGKVLKVNLIEEKMLLASNGGMYACPAAQQIFQLGFPGYYNSWLRDDTIAVIYLSKMGLQDEYLVPHAELVKNNYRHETLVNGTYKWWDVFYNYCNNNEGGTQFSQADSAFYGIWSLYKAWKLLGHDSYVTGGNYDLMKETIRYFRQALTYDPYTGKNIIYFDSNKQLFKEMRINEADITADTPGYPKSPKTGKKLQFVDSLYINVLFYANYLMLAEAAEHNDKLMEKETYLAYAADLKNAINANLWSKEKSRYIAGIAYNEDGYEQIDFDSWNIGFDYIWAMTLPDDKHLPFPVAIKEHCLQSVYDAGYWNNTVFGKADIATDLACARRVIVEEIIADAKKVDASDGVYYYYPYSIPEQFEGTNLPQAFAIAPSLYALCLTTTKAETFMPLSAR